MTNPSRYPAEFNSAPVAHQYTLGLITLFLALVLGAATSLRGASRAIAVVMRIFGLPTACPAWSTGRLWLLRLGYYKLMRPKAPAPDWVWIVDHTVQLGPEKCLLIVGVRLSTLPATNCRLRHEQVEPLELLPVTQSTGEIVYQQLEATRKKTGTPRAIVSDHGSDLKAGIERFCQAHPETASLYDIKHKVALVLKHELHRDEQWQHFCQQAAHTRSQLQQTALAPLAPPPQKAKARYMNVGCLLDWAEKILAFLACQPPELTTTYEPTVVETKLGWVRDFRDALASWRELFAVALTTETFVRTQGLSRGCHRQLKKRLTGIASTAPAKRVQQALVSFVAEEAFQANPGERLVASSEVIESIFGSLKRLAHDQVKSGFTGLILAVAALVSTTTVEVVKTALETVPTKRVINWCQQKLGKSVQAKRKEALTCPNKKEQKQDQVAEAA